MKIIKFLILISCFSFSTSLFSQNYDSSSDTGNYYLPACKKLITKINRANLYENDAHTNFDMGACMGFVSAQLANWHMHIMTHHVALSPKYSNLDCCNYTKYKKVTTVMAVKAFVKYMQNSRSKLKESATILFEEAMREYFPMPIAMECYKVK